MTKRIFRSICFVAIAVFLSSLVLIMGVLYSYFSEAQMKQLKIQTEFVANAVELEGIDYLGRIKDNTYRMTLIDNNGHVLFDNKVSSGEMENHLERREIKDALEKGRGTATRYSTTMTERQFYSALRLENGTILRLSVSQLAWWTLLLGMLQPIIIVMMIATGLSLFLAYRLSQRIVEPLNAINLEEPDKAKAYDEISPLLKRLELQQKQIKQQQAELAQKRNEFEAATENMSEGILLLNPTGRIISINKSASRLFGISSYCVGKDLLLFNSSLELRKLLLTASGGKHSEMVVTMGEINYQFNVSPIISDGVISGIALIIFDITEKEKSEQLRREFTANVSHELRTPLQTIAGSAELLSCGMVKSGDIQKFSQRIYAEAKHLMALIEDIIKLSHLDEDAAGMPSEKVDLFELAETVVENLKCLADDAYVKLSLDGESAVLNGKPQLLFSIIFNLCDNAIKYNKRDGRVSITIKNEKDKVVLTVSDTGIGISPEKQLRIFERFYRVDRSHSKEVGGTGLGLSIVKHAAKIHNADIELHSVVDKGTAVIVTFSKE